VRTFKVPFTASLMGVAEVEAETYEDAAFGTSSFWTVGET
jgi:hypothetical protein